MKPLVALACVVVIACGGVWLAGQWQDQQAAAEARATAEIIEKGRQAAWVDVQRANRQAEVDACAADLDAYDTRNNSFAFMQRAVADGDALTGESMLIEVQACRDLVGG